MAGLLHFDPLVRIGVAEVGAERAHHEVAPRSKKCARRGRERARHASRAVRRSLGADAPTGSPPPLRIRCFLKASRIFLRISCRSRWLRLKKPGPAEPRVRLRNSRLSSGCSSPPAWANLFAICPPPGAVCGNSPGCSTPLDHPSRSPANEPLARTAPVALSPRAIPTGSASAITGLCNGLMTRSRSSWSP